MNVEVKAPILHFHPVFVDGQRIGSVRYVNGGWHVLGWGWTPKKQIYKSKQEAVDDLVSQWRPGVSALKVDRSGSDDPLSGKVAEPGPSLDRGETISPRLYHE